MADPVQLPVDTPEGGDARNNGEGGNALNSGDGGNTRNNGAAGGDGGASGGGQPYHHLRTQQTPSPKPI